MNVTGNNIRFFDSVYKDNSILPTGKEKITQVIINGSELLWSLPLIGKSHVYHAWGITKDSTSTTKVAYVALTLIFGSILFSQSLVNAAIILGISILPKIYHRIQGFDHLKQLEKSIENLIVKLPDSKLKTMIESKLLKHYLSKLTPEDVLKEDSPVRLLYRKTGNIHLNTVEVFKFFLKHESLEIAFKHLLVIDSSLKIVKVIAIIINLPSIWKCLTGI